MTNPTNPTPEQVLLRDGSLVSANFYYELHWYVTEQIMNMPIDHSMTLRQICGEEYWRMLSDGERRLAGICVSTMVENGDLPLIGMGKNSSHHQLYCFL